jgi:hypothetical protein
MPSFQVQPCTEADIPRVFEIISLAFDHDHEYMDSIFPAHDALEGRSVGAERILQIFHGDPYGHFMKVVDTDTGIVAGAAKWNIYEKGVIPPQPAIDGNYWKSEEDKEFAEETNGELVGMHSASSAGSRSQTNRGSTRDDDGRSRVSMYGSWQIVGQVGSGKG